MPLLSAALSMNCRFSAIQCMTRTSIPFPSMSCGPAARWMCYESFYRKKFMQQKIYLCRTFYGFRVNTAHATLSSAAKIICQLSLFATHVELLIDIEPTYQNDISLCGFICKPVSYRKTPLGREISDILIAVNRKFGKSDYIPCVAWGRNAVFAAQLKVGTQIQIQGRIQSRTYTKKTAEGERSYTANEVSIIHLTIAD